ncbi:MAG TPA: hypothetical protein PKN32_11545 [Bacteroidales bacterium]|nr:hypothetical protein [Bacteroidales bacterium]
MLKALKTLNEILNNIDDTAKKKLVGNHLDAFYWKIYITDYHIEESVKVFNHHEGISPEEEYIEIVKDIFNYHSKSPNGLNYRIAVFKSEANLIAAAQSMHSLADICAHIIYRSLNDLQNTIPEKNIGIKSLIRELKKKSKYDKIVLAIKGLTDSNEFKYLEGYVNTAKHKSLIPTTHTVSFAHKEIVEQYLSINEFEYDGIIFTKLKSSELSNLYFNNLKNQYKEIFNALCGLLIE